jgi:glycosyltransferase involved in cell wall biosynthesis
MTAPRTIPPGIAHNAGATVYSHPYNIGNGAAVKTGIRVANGKILVFMDGDGQHRPEDIGRMLAVVPGI